MIVSLMLQMSLSFIIFTKQLTLLAMNIYNAPKPKPQDEEGLPHPPGTPIKP